MRPLVDVRSPLATAEADGGLDRVQTGCHLLVEEVGEAGEGGPLVLDGRRGGLAELGVGVVVGVGVRILAGGVVVLAVLVGVDLCLCGSDKYSSICVPLLRS